jgi:hypothetical protein
MMNQGKGVEALLHLRKLRGGSQPILVRANDGYFYVVKFLNNLQGPHLLFNEAIGTEVFRSAGLLVPEWRAIHVSDEFIDRNPSCWMETEVGRRRPQAGWCFGSRFLGQRNTTLYEMLPQGSFSRIENRQDFQIAWVLDTFCGHADNRQAVFLERKSRRLEAYFIDHGHLFGGVRGVDSPSYLVSRYLDPRIYADVSARDADEIQRAIQGIDLKLLSEIVGGLPAEWSTEGAVARLERFMSQVSDPVLLKNAVHFILGMQEHGERSHDRRLAKCTIGFKRACLHGQILPSGVENRIGGGCAVLAGDQGPCESSALYPSFAHAANF